MPTLSGDGVDLDMDMEDIAGHTTLDTVTLARDLLMLNLKQMLLLDPMPTLSGDGVDLDMDTEDIAGHITLDTLILAESKHFLD